MKNFCVIAALSFGYFCLNFYAKLTIFAVSMANFGNVLADPVPSQKEVFFKALSRVLDFPFVPLSGMLYDSGSRRYEIYAVVLSSIFWAVATYVVFSFITSRIKRRDSKIQTDPLLFYPNGF